MSLKNSGTPPGIDPGTVRLVPQRLNHYATPGPVKLHIFLNIEKHNVDVSFDNCKDRRWCLVVTTVGQAYQQIDSWGLRSSEM